MNIGSLDSYSVNLLSKADRLVGRLAGTMDRLNANEIRQGLLTRETTALCGENLSDYLSDLAGNRKIPANVVLAQKILHQAASSAGGSPIAPRQMAEWHGRLQGDVSGERRAEHRYADVAEILKMEGPFLIRAGLMLCETTILEFEIPGARRTGQMLFSALCVAEGMIPWPGLGLSPFLSATSADHIKLCKAAAKNGNPAKWIEYFLTGVARQCEDVISRITGIEELIEKWKMTAEGRCNRMAAKLIEGLAANPFLTVKGAAANLDVAFTTAQRAVDKLLKANIIQETTLHRRDRVYCAKEILAVLEEPPRVMDVSPWREEEKIPELESAEEIPAKTTYRHDPSAKLPLVY